MKSIIIADDSPLILEGLSNQINGMNIFDRVVIANNGFELLEEFKNNPTDLLIIDIAMPKMSGFDVVKKIRLFNKDVPIILISNFNRDEIEAKCLHVGANGFIHKMHFAEEINSAINTIKQNARYFSNDIIPNAESVSYNSLTGLECYEIKQKLSKREYEVFGQLGVTSESNLISENLNISRKTIDNHVENIKKKLMLSSKHKLYRIATVHYHMYGNFD